MNKIEEYILAKKKDFLDFLKDKDHVFIFGDGDADGITASAFLADFLKSIEMSFSFLVPPDGFRKSYKEHLKDKENIIFVDYNIGEEVVKFLNESGKAFFVIDHHKGYYDEKNYINPFVALDLEKNVSTALISFLLFSKKRELEKNLTYIASELDTCLEGSLPLISLETPPSGVLWGETRWLLSKVFKNQELGKKVFDALLFSLEKGDISFFLSECSKNGVIDIISEEIKNEWLSLTSYKELLSKEKVFVAFSEISTKRFLVTFLKEKYPEKAVFVLVERGDYFLFSIRDPFGKALEFVKSCKEKIPSLIGGGHPQAVGGRLKKGELSSFLGEIDAFYR